MKDFVDDKTQREMAKVAGGVERERPYISADALLGYLKEPHTTQEIQVRFGYASLSTTYQALRSHMIDGRVSALGRGLYVSNTSPVISFNAGDLSEHELQERGLEAFKKVSKQRRTADSGRTLKYKRRDDRRNAIVAFCSEPKSNIEIAQEMGYKAVDSANPMIRSLIKNGSLIVHSHRNGHRLFLNPLAQVDQAGEEMIAEGTDTLGPEIPLPPLKIDAAFSVHQLEELAKTYFWECEPSDWTRDELRKFISWGKTQETGKVNEV